MMRLSATVALGTLLALAAGPAATAQTGGTIKIEIKGPKPEAPPATGTTAKAPFGCDTRPPGVCYFRVFYQRGARDIVLPAGMKDQVPDVRLEKDTYCVEIGKKPKHPCARKVINAKYNS